MALCSRFFPRKTHIKFIQETFLKKGDAGTSLTCEEELVGKILKKYNWGNRNCQDVMLCYVI